MLRNHGVNLKQLYASEGAVATCEKLRGALLAGELKPEDFSIREIAEAFLGSDNVGRFNPARQGDVLIRADEEAVDSTAFANISGQIVYSRIMEKYKEADQGLFEQLCTVVPTNFNGEKIPGIGKILDEEFEVHEGKEFPETGFGEDYQETPSTTKHGLMLKITKEAIFFDRTGIILRDAGSIGERLATGRLKRLLKVVIGAVNNYNWKGTAYNTYLTTGAWINKVVSHELLNYTDMEEAEVLWADMIDPDTGNPIVFGPFRQLLITPRLAYTARSILNATEVDLGDTTDATVPVRRGPNPIQGWASPIVSALLYQLLQSELSFSAANAAKTWLTGDFRKAFWYMQNWGITVVQAPKMNPEEFTKDIVAAWRASERGVPAVGNPRYVQFHQPQA